MYAGGEGGEGGGAQAGWGVGLGGGVRGTCTTSCYMKAGRKVCLKSSKLRATPVGSYANPRTARERAGGDGCVIAAG